MTNSVFSKRSVQSATSLAESKEKVLDGVNFLGESIRRLAINERLVEANRSDLKIGREVLKNVSSAIQTVAIQTVSASPLSTSKGLCH